MPRPLTVNANDVARQRAEKAESLATGKRPSSRGQKLNGVITVRGNSLRDRIAQWVEIRTAEPHLRQREIAEKMGIAPTTLTRCIADARKAGFLQFEDPLDKIEYQIVPKVLDNLMEFLDQKDKTVTLETAKGTIFKQYQGAKGVSDAPTNVLALKIEMPDGTQGAKILTGQIVGQPRVLTE